MGLKKIDHIGIAVKSIKDSVDFYEKAFQLKPEAIEEVPSECVRVAFLRVGESNIELLEPLNEESPIFKFIEKKGEGVHHIALGVNSIEERIAQIKENGFRMINEEAKEGAEGAKIAFIHPKSAGGVLFEMCEKSSGEEN